MFFLFYQFWGLFGTQSQVAILLTASIASFGLTLWVQRLDSSGYFSKLAALVAFTCFVLNIVMLGQIFNITPSNNALLPWALYALLLAYACGARLLLAAGLSCLLAFVAARIGSWDGIYWLGFAQRPENFILPALLMSFGGAFVALLLTRVSGINLLDAIAKKRWGDDPAWQAYVARTPVLFPRPPRA